MDGIDLLQEDVYTVEGNTDGSGTREGGGVHRLERGLASVFAFGRYGGEG